ncbi:MAG TPA: DUF1003 domain-containing protein [Longimicrobium sp.]|nr:DUF1003 domain-containing protein [Longimicrobium sp.]
MNTHLHFPRPFRHDHPPVVDTSELEETNVSAGQRAADAVAATMGSWRFIIIQSIILAAWIGLNVVAFVRHWDPYPFILMNLVLSTQAAYAAPIIMMSQNRQAARDRMVARNDYELNQKAEVEVAAVLEHLAAQDRALEEVHRMVANLCAERGVQVAPHTPPPILDAGAADPPAR